MLASTGIGTVNKRSFLLGSLYDVSRVNCDFPHGKIMKLSSVHKLHDDTFYTII